MAKIRKRGDTYQFTVSLGYMNGKQVCAYKTFHPTSKTPKAIQKEVEQEATLFEKEVTTGKIPTKKTKFYDFAVNWRDNWAPQHLTIGQREQYWSALENRVFPAVGAMYIADITSIKMENSIFKPMRDEGLGADSLRRVFTALNSVMTYAYTHEVIDKNVCDRIDLPSKAGKDETEIHFFTPDEGKRFLQYLNRDYDVQFGERRRNDSKGNSYTVGAYSITKEYSTMTRAYFTLALLSGIRRGEQCALTWEDIDFDECTISINKAVAMTKQGVILKDTKTKSGRRVLQLPSDVFTLLKEWKQEEYSQYKAMGTAWEGEKDFEKTWVFIQKDGSRMHPSTPSHSFRKICKRYNDMIEKKAEEASTEAERQAILKLSLPEIHLHDLRHSAITALIASGLDIVSVSHFAGHSKPSITSDIYAHYLRETDKRMADSLAKAFGNLNPSEPIETRMEETARVLS